MAETALALVDPQQLIMKALDKGVDVETMERLVALAKDVRATQSKEAFHDAMARFREKCPPIYKTRRAKMKNYSYTFSPLDEICSTVDPILGELGLSYRWSTPTITSEHVQVECIVTHRLGHSESSGVLEMPVMSAVQRQEGGEGGANAMQRVGISLTYAKRYTMLGILGVAPEDDEDGRAPESGDEAGERSGGGNGQATGEVISEPQANRLWAIARQQVWDQDAVHALLKKHGIESVKQIPRGRKYDELVDAIKSEKKTPPASSKDQQQGSL